MRCGQVIKTASSSPWDNGVPDELEPPMPEQD